MAGPYQFGPPKIDFSPLASLLDPVIEGIEKRRQEKLMLAALAPETATARVAPASGPVVPGAALGIGGSRKMAMPADPETERKFLDTVKSSGLTNPVAVAALAAHVNAESGFSPANFTRTWSDPSESGKPGTSGGALSWRGDRLTKMLQATQGQDPVVAQAKYALAENPEMAVALQNAKSLSEAHSVLANSQRYAGYDRPGGENARRLALAQNYAARLGGNLNAAVAEADLPQAGGTPAQYAVPGQTAPAAGVAPAAAPDASPQKIQALKALAVGGAPAQRQWALNEISRLTTAKNPMNLGNGILYDPRTGKVTDFSAAATKKPEAIQLYEQAKKEGFTGNFIDYKKATTGGNTTINNVLPSDQTYDKEVAKDYGELFSTTQKEARSADVALGNLKVMDKLIDNPDFYSGTGGSTVTAIKRAMVSMGIKDANTAQPNELFDKLANRALLDASGGKLGAGFSNADREFMGRTGANVENTPAGNRAILRMAIKAEARKKEIAQRARDYARSHKGRLDAGFDQELAEWSEANPAFAEEIKALEAGPRPPIAPYVPPGMPPPASHGQGQYKVRRLPDA
jgi:hypothetical protein